MWAIAGSLQYPPLTTATTDWLSQWQQTVSPLQDAPHMAVATMIGSNSFAAIDAAAKLGHSLHATWTHWVFHSAPHPQVPDASLHIWISGDSTSSLLIIETPFQAPTNVCHHSRSALNPAFSLIIWFCLRNWDSRPKIPLRNLLPGLTTLHA